MKGWKSRAVITIARYQDALNTQMNEWEELMKLAMKNIALIKEQQTELGQATYSLVKESDEHACIFHVDYRPAEGDSEEVLADKNTKLGIAIEQARIYRVLLAERMKDYVLSIYGSQDAAAGSHIMMCVNSGLVELLVEETVAGEALRIMAEVKEEVEKQVQENMDKQQQFRDMFKAMTGQDMPEGVSGMLLDALRGIAEDDSDESGDSDESDDE